MTHGRNKTERPKIVRPSYAGLSLTPEEGFVLSRIDGNLTLKDLVDLTGLPSERIDAIVLKLETQGVVGFESIHATVAQAMAPPSSVRAVDVGGSMDPEGAESAADGIYDAYIPDEPIDEDYEGGEEFGSLQELLGGVVVEAEAPSSSPSEWPDEPDTERDLEADEVPDAASMDPETTRGAFEREFRHQPIAERMRVAVAGTARQVFPLCCDPDPGVIGALLSNPHVGLNHARAVAFMHHTAQGIEQLVKRPEFLRDAGVHRRLLRNTHISESFLKRLLGGKPMGELFRTAMDHDVPTLTRGRVREILRARFTQAQPEERVELLVRNEGRVLPLLTGCNFDQRTTQLLVARNIVAPLFIQNLGKFAATPPTLLLHLVKQNIVKRNPQLKKLLIAHRNMPSEGKRL
jgi:hypothetical protein